MDQQMDRWTDKASYRDAWTHLKRRKKVKKCVFFSKNPNEHLEELGVLMPPYRRVGSVRSVSGSGPDPGEEIVHINF